MNKGLITCKLQFYSADKSDTSIIAYGDIDGIRAYKVTFTNKLYELHKMSNGKYKPQCVMGSLDLCIGFAFKMHEK